MLTDRQPPLRADKRSAVDRIVVNLADVIARERAVGCVEYGPRCSRSVENRHPSPPRPDPERTLVIECECFDEVSGQG